MNYNVDELFCFRESENGCAIKDYLKKVDPSITELELPEEYNGLPVVTIEMNAFSHAEYLKKVVLPKSLKEIGDSAFWYCDKLESVIFNSAPSIEDDVFFGCRSLSADVALMGLLGSCDLSTPFDKKRLANALDSPSRQLVLLIFEDNRYDNALLSPEVFELAAKNNCFRNVDKSVIHNALKEKWDLKLLRIAGEHDLLDSSALLDEFIELSVRRGTPEITAYLLELKKRKFGFNGGGNFEL